MFKRIIFFLVVFSIPFQLGIHFWLPQSYVSSFRIDYLSPTIYLVDIFILFYLISEIRQAVRIILLCFTSKVGLAIFGLLFLNLWKSSFNPITTFYWGKIIIYYLLFNLLRSEKQLKQRIAKPFLLSLGIVLLLAIVQIVLQRSLGGLFYYLGERPLNISIPNVAKLDFSILGKFYQVLRPYSTFSHPNSLAGYLLVALSLLPFLTKSRAFRIITALVIILTFSKAAILTLFLVFYIEITLSQGILIALLLSLTPLLNLGKSYSSRLHLLIPTLNIIQHNLLTGVGLRQFIPAVAKEIPGNQQSYITLQPVHNIFMLILSELGLLSSTFFIWLLTKSKIKKSIFQILQIIVLTGSLDHYWWTLNQNQLIIPLALAILLQKNDLQPNNHKHRWWI